MYGSKRGGLNSTTNTIGGPSTPTTVPLPTEAFTDIRTKILQRYGKGGLKLLGQAIRAIANSSGRDDGTAAGNIVVNADVLRSGMREALDVCISDTDYARIVAALNCNNNNNNSSSGGGGEGDVPVRDFIIGLRGNVPNRRKNVIEQSFRRLDPDNTGFVDLAALHNAYDASRHPQVVAKRATKDEMTDKFLSYFSPSAHPDGLVSVEEFVNFYVGVSATVMTDEAFELLLIRSWALDRPSNAAAALAASKGSPSGQDGVSYRYNANHGVPLPPKSHNYNGSLNGSQSSTASGSGFSSSSPNSANNTIGYITEDGAIARRDHPLYRTSMMDYGLTSAQHAHDPAHHRPGGFTKNAPPFSAGSGLNTATTRSRVI